MSAEESHTRRSWRYTLAQRIAAAYAEDPNTRVVMIAGSVGRSTDDRFSDIEIDVYYERPPTVQERTATVVRCGGVLEGLDEDDDEWEEQMSLGGFHAASSTFLCSTMERYLVEVIDQGLVAPPAQTRLYSLQQAVTVKGAPQVERWRERTRHYPQHLVEAMLQENLVFDGFWYAEEMLAARDDWLVLYEIFVGVEKQIVRALLGLNRQYLPTPEKLKWLDQIIAAMTIKPDNLAARLKGAFRGDPMDGVRDLKVLIAETLTLVEAHQPTFDTAPYRANFARLRQVWDEPPTLPT
jgi:hypothetical protein